VCDHACHTTSMGIVSIFSPLNYPCSCPSALDSSMDLRDLGHWAPRVPLHMTSTADPSTHAVTLQKMTQQRSGYWMTLSSGSILFYLTVRSMLLTIWMSVCVHFSPPTLLGSPLSSAALWLPASTLPHTQPAKTTTLCCSIPTFT